MTYFDISISPYCSFRPTTLTALPFFTAEDDEYVLDLVDGDGYVKGERSKQAKGPELLANMILTSRARARTECDIISQSCPGPLTRGFRLLHLLQCDMLSSYARSVLTSIDRRLRAENSTDPVPSRVKTLLMLLLVIWDVLVVGYLVWFSVEAVDIVQMSLFQSFTCWLLLDILFVETLSVYLIHVLFPLSIQDELRESKHGVCDLIIKSMEGATAGMESSLDVSRCFLLALHHTETCETNQNKPKPI